ncbi:MAG: sugar phosphate isomerase/epimerase family protein [Bacteroidota bacterium]
MNRRSFLQTTAGLASTVALSRVTPALASPPPSVTIRKALKYSMIGVEGMAMADKFRMAKDLGYDGIEMDSPNEFRTEDVLAARDAADLPIHGVVDSVHWQQTLGDADPAVRQAGLDGLLTALRDAHAYGASTVLLVPAVVGKAVSYQDAWDRSQAEIRKALPLAEELGVQIAIENVWNHFLLSPLEAARYIDAFESPWIGWYFDIGNIVNYGWPEQWIRTLGPRILKLDVKEFSRGKRNDEGLWKGFGVEIGAEAGDCDWPAVNQALADIGYSGWATAEVRGGDRDRLADVLARMHRVFSS